MTGLKRLRWKSEYGILLALLVFFGGLFVVFGVQEYPDSETYIRMYLGREPVYPLFLKLLQMIFRDGFKLAAGILQNLLAVWSVYLLVCYVKRRFLLNGFGTGCILVLFLVPHLMTPLGSASQMVYTSSILSEGISYSIFNFVVFFLCRLVLEERKQIADYCGAYGTALLLSLARGQMMPMLLVWGCVGLYAALVSERGRKRIVRCLLVALFTMMSFGIRNGLMYTYNVLVKHVEAVNLESGTTFLTNVIYSADAEDGDHIPEEGIRNTFYYIQGKAQEQGWNYEAAGSGVLGQALHLEESHDLIKFNQVELFITWYLNDAHGLDGRAREVQTDAVATQIAKQVLPQSFSRWLYVYFSLAVVGFIRTVAIVHPILNWYALACYLAAVCLMLYLFRKDRKSKAARCMLFVFLLICANVFATSITIMCLSRYMIYNMSFFYLAVFLMLWEIWTNRFRTEKEWPQA